MNYYIFKLNFFQKIKIKIFSLTSAQIFSSVFFNKSNNVGYPESELYTQITQDSRKYIFNYFERYKEIFKNNTLLFDYVKKYYDFEFTNFFIFMHQVKNKNLKENQILADSFLKKIFFNSHNSSLINKFNVFIKLFLSLFVFFIFFTRCFYFCIVSKKKITNFDILYLRKKNYPDFLYDSLDVYLKKKNLDSKCLIMLFSLNKSSDQFIYLNNVKGSPLLSIKALILTLKDLIKVFPIFIKVRFNFSFLLSYLISSFTSFYITSLSAKIITGVLLDKPIFSLIYKNRFKKHICSLNEAFMFKPFRTFDYCNLDVYFYMNNFDLDNINIYGGKINKPIMVPFFRKNFKKNTKILISEDLQLKLQKFDKKIIITPSMVTKNFYKPTSIKFLSLLIKNLIKHSNTNKNILYIIKEKKGELSYLDSDLYAHIQSSDNFFVIKSLRPKLLKYNQFEEIISFADLLISISSTSTTVLQSLSQDIPFVAINCDHPHSFYKKYPNCEIKVNELSNSINYWLNLSIDVKKDFLQKIKFDLNLSKSSGLETIAEYYSEYLKK